MGIEGKVVSVDFYGGDKLPTGLKKEAKKKRFKATKKIIAVKTIIGSPPLYEFENVGSTPREIRKYMGTLAKADGEDLSKVVKKAFGD